MKKEYGAYVLFYDVDKSELICMEELSIAINIVPSSNPDSFAKEFAKKWADQRMIDMDANSWTLWMKTEDESKLIQVIVDHLELCNIVPDNGTLEELVTEFLCEFYCDPSECVKYVSEWYDISIPKTKVLLEELEKFREWVY